MMFPNLQSGIVTISWYSSCKQVVFYVVSCFTVTDQFSKGSIQSLETYINKWLSIQLLTDQVAALKNNGDIEAIYSY